MQNPIKWFINAANEIVAEHEKTVTLGTWLTIAFFAGVAFSEFRREYFSEFMHGGTETSGDISQIIKLQATYKEEINPVIARWLEVTREIERSDPLPSELEKIMSVERILRSEIKRMQTEHSKALSAIAETSDPE